MRLKDISDPSRKRRTVSGEQTWSAVRAKRKRDSKQLSAAVDANGIYVAVTNVVCRALFNITQSAKARDSLKRYQETHRHQLNAKRRLKRKNNGRYRISCNLRSRLADFVRSHGIIKGDSTTKLVGLSWGSLELHLRSMLRPTEMLESVDVDHIFPMARYDLENNKQQRNCMSYSNLQPLPHRDNVSKSAKLPTKAMAAKVDPDKWPPGITEDMLPDIYPGWDTPLRMHAAPTPGASSSTDPVKVTDDASASSDDDDVSESSFDGDDVSESSSDDNDVPESSSDDDDAE